MGWEWALIRGWALNNFFCLKDEHLFEVGANSRLGDYSNKYEDFAKVKSEAFLYNILLITVKQNKIRLN